MQRKERKRPGRLRIPGMLLLFVAIVLFARHTFIRYQEREAAVQAIKERGQKRLEEEAAGASARTGILEHNGKTYRRNTAVRAILCLGVDTVDEMEKQNVSGTGGQADSILLVAQDAAEDTVQIVMIPRDTMTEITLFDYFGNELGKDTRQLTLAYAYGDGREKSCQLVSEAVSELLFGLEIDGYFAANMSTIAVFNDEVGGVPATIEDPSLAERYPEFTLGDSVLLQGEQAIRYVRYRDINEPQTAMRRLERQKDYLKSFIKTAKQRYHEDEQLIVRLVDDVETYMITDLAKDQYMDMGLAFLNSPQVMEDGDFISVPGEVVETELYEEFYPDMEILKEIIIRLFYKEGN